MLENDLHTWGEKVSLICDLGSMKYRGNWESAFLCFWQYFAPHGAARLRTVADIV